MPKDSRHNMPGKAAPRSDPPSQLDGTLLKIVDAALAGCIFVVPLLMGGRHPCGQLALTALASVAAVTWVLRLALRRGACWRPCRTEWLLAAGVTLLLVQIVPLPQSVLAWAAPRHQQALPLWTSQADPSGGLGAWSCISTTPAETRGALSLLLAYGLLFLVTVQRIRSVENVERLLRWIAASTVIMAGFGLVQLLLSNGKFFWVYKHPFSHTSAVATGSFTNRNHFAHFLALGIGPLIWWLQFRPHRRKPGRAGSSAPSGTGGPGRKELSGWRTLPVGVVLFAGLLSLSRGGAIAIFLAAAIGVAVSYRARVLGARFALTLAAVAVLGAAMLSIHGYDRFAGRMGQLTSGSIEQIDGKSHGRRHIWATTLRASSDYRLLGAGAGSFREVYPIYDANPGRTEETHAENGPVQVLLETGIVGLGLLLIGIGFCAHWCIGGLRAAGSSRMLVCLGAVSAGLSASVVHSLVDFVWYVPACMAIVAVLAACACRLWQLARETTQEPIRPLAVPRFAVIGATLVLSVMGGWMVVNRAGPTLAQPHWDRYRIMELATAVNRPDRGVDESTGRPYQVDDASADEIARMIRELKQVVSYHPDHARAHLRLAAAYLRSIDLALQESENAMPMVQIQHAATQHWLAATDELQRQQVDRWLEERLAGHRQDLERARQHVRRGLALCPLQGEGYLYAAELQFLDGAGADAKRPAYVDQALRVRPFDGAVLFEAGRSAALQGDWQSCLQHWKRSCRCGRKHQHRVLEALADNRFPLPYLLEYFQPDLDALSMLDTLYGRLGNPQDLAVLRQHYVSKVVREAQDLQGKDAARRWLEARKLHQQLGNSQQSWQCAQFAFDQCPNDYGVRHHLAQSLIQQQRFAEAGRHLEWCLRQRPSDARLRQLLRQVADRRAEQRPSSPTL